MKTIERNSEVKIKTEKAINYMQHGVVTDVDLNLNRAYVTWPQHGETSIPLDQLELQ